MRALPHHSKNGPRRRTANRRESTNASSKSSAKLKMPLLELPRRMTVVRLNTGGLVIFSAIALEESNMAGLEALGGQPS